jgi:putative flippase GtrA
MRLRHEFMLFAVGGLIGLVVAAGVVQLLVSFAHINPYIAWVISFLLAATATWWWNRNHTFATAKSGRSLLTEWLHWIVLMSGGAVVNYAVYWLCLHEFPGWYQWPSLASAVGSVVAALVNFSSARTLLFRRAKTRS